MSDETSRTFFSNILGVVDMEQQFLTDFFGMAIMEYESLAMDS